MLTSFVLSLALAASVTPAAQGRTAGGPSDPPVRLSLNSDGRYRPGERARVNVRSEEDGYLLVLRTDVDGWVRVLYPADPFDDDFVRGGREIDIRDRGDRESFAVSRHNGSGVVVAVYSSTALDFKAFVRGDHWDYRALDSLRSESDPEAALLSIVDGMSGGNHFDYDVATYTVSDGRSDYDQSYAAGYYPPCFGCYSGFGLSFGFGRRFGSYYRAGYYDPFYSDPFLYDPACWSDLFCYPGSYRGWGYGYRYGYAYSPFRFDVRRRSLSGPSYTLGAQFATATRYGNRGGLVFRNVQRVRDRPTPVASRPQWSGGNAIGRRSEVAGSNVAQRRADRPVSATRVGARPVVRSSETPRTTVRREPSRGGQGSDGGGYRGSRGDRGGRSSASNNGDRGGRSSASSNGGRGGRSSAGGGGDRGGRSTASGSRGSSGSSGRSSGGGGGGGRRR